MIEALEGGALRHDVGPRTPKSGTGNRFPWDGTTSWTMRNARVAALLVDRLCHLGSSAPCAARSCSPDSSHRVPLIITPDFDSPDAFYEALIDAHKDLSTPESHAMNARLVLIRSNPIGRIDVLRAGLRAPRNSAPSSMPHNATATITTATATDGPSREGRT